ncbi:hydroxyphenylacetyl-CoA thioesterase PaaI [soil metagenome]
MTAGLSPQQIADAVAVGMLAADSASRALGMRIPAMAPGRATLLMTVRDDMVNGVQTCHGGIIATLADSAFAFACNSSNELTVAAGFGIDFIAPGRLGDVLTATATEVALAGRTGVYDVEVTNQHGERIAVFRGRSHRLKGRTTVTLD